MQLRRLRSAENRRPCCDPCKEPNQSDMPAGSRQGVNWVARPLDVSQCRLSCKTRKPLVSRSHTQGSSPRKPLICRNRNDSGATWSKTENACISSKNCDRVLDIGCHMRPTWSCFSSATSAEHAASSHADRAYGGRSAALAVGRYRGWLLLVLLASPTLHPARRRRGRRCVLRRFQATAGSPKRGV